MLTKKKTFYSVICSEIDSYGERNGGVNTYGIEVLSDNDEIFTVEDISICREFVEDLADIFNRNELSPLHLYDVLTDIL